MRKSSFFRRLMTAGLIAGIVGSMLPVGQASAGTRAWTSVTIPVAPAALATSRTVISNSDIRSIATNGNSLVAAVGSDLGNGAVATGDDIALSTDSGRTWTIVDPDSTAGGAVAIIAVAYSPNFATDRTIFAASTTKVYRSTNGGSSWATLGADQGAGTVVITSLSVSPTYDGVGPVAIGLANTADAAMPANGVMVWGLDGVLNWVAPGGALAGDVTSVAFSPNYGADGTLLAVNSTSVGPATTLNSLVGATTSAAVAWNASGGPTPLSASEELGDATTGILSTSIAVPSDYNASVTSTRTVWVGINATGAIGDVYRGTTFSATAAATLLGADAGDVSSVLFSGPRASGTLYAGMAANAVFRSTTATATTVTWDAATTAPIPGASDVPATVNTKLAVSGSNLFAANMGAGAGAADEQTGVSVSTDGGVNFSQIALIDAATSLTRITDIAVSGKVAFLSSTEDTAGVSTNSLWKTSDITASTPLWDRVSQRDTDTSAVGELFLIAMSPNYATDSTLFWIDGTSATGGVIRRTTNGGASFTSTSGSGSGAAINSAVALDGSTLVVGSAAGGLRRSTNAGFIWSTPVITGATGPIASIARSPAYATDMTALLGDGAGNVFISTDSGANWAAVNSTSIPFGAGDNVTVAFDMNYATNGVIYAASSSAGDGIRRSVNRGSWSTLDATAGIGYGQLAAGYASKALLSGGDGTLYAAEGIGTATVVKRSTNPTASTSAPVDFETAATFANMNNSSSTGTLAATIGPMAWAAGSDILYAVQTDAADRVRAYTDTFSNPMLVPTVASPMNDAQTGIVAAGAATVTIGTITFTWPNVTGAGGYQVQIATDASFANIVAGETQVVAATTGTNTTALNLTALPANVRYYWRVRALLDSSTAPAAPAVATSDLISRWSTPATFVAGASATGVAIPTLTTPVMGAINYADTNAQPVFVWTAVTGATNYELQVSTDGTFADATKLAIDKTGSNRLGNQLAYQDTAVSLTPTTTYFWRVRAYNSTASGGAITGAWSPASAFRTTSVTSSTTAVSPTVALAAAEATGKLEVVTSFDYSSGQYQAYVPGLPGNKLTTIAPNSVIFVTLKQNATVTVSGVSFDVKANTPTPLPVGSTVSIAVTLK